METWVRVGLMVAGALLILTFTALNDRREESARLRWPLLLVFLGVGVSAFGSAGLQRGGWGWWAIVLWAALLTVAALTGTAIRRSRQRRGDLVERSTNRRPR